ncbi:MAG: hypothetical protein GY707_05195 [Desulfobacteraceae bacterium]|nr:hypothetical protein [Desulfobacteraceae bacterium]
MASDIKKVVTVEARSKGFDKATKAVNAYGKAGGRAQAEQDKLEKGTANIGKNATANFAKMSQGLGGLVHVYATVAANVFALSSAFMVLKEATDVDIMVRAADQLSTSTGISYANVAKNMKGVTQGAVSMQEALRSASIGVSSGLSGKQMQDIAEIATKAANALGRSVPEAINRMTQAVVKNEPELVDEYGIILRVDSAMKDYAATLGKTKSELTSFDKQMAIHAQLVKQGSTKFGDVEGQVNAYNQLGASFSELTHNVVSFINTALEPLVSLFAENKSLLAAVAAIFAHGVFKKAVPELQNMNSRLKEQRDIYKSLIAQQKERLSDLENIGKAQSIEVGLKNVPKSQIKKDYLDVFKNLPTDVLKNEFSKAARKGLQSGTKSGLKTFKKELSASSFMGNITENVENLNHGTLKQRQLAVQNLKTYGLQADVARGLVTRHQILNKIIKQSSIDSKTELSSKDKALVKLQQMTAELQKQRLIAKDIRASAFAEGASGGFLGGGLSSANKGIKEARDADDKVSMLSAGAARVAGIFGNISGILGGIMSLVSGWGIALFVVSQAILPISDGLGLTNKKARESLDNFETLNEELIKLQETSEKIKAKSFEDLQGLIDKTSASANNLNEQMSKTIEQLDTLGQISQLTTLDKIFNLDLNVEQNAIKSIVKSIQDMRRAQGIEQDSNLESQVVQYSKIGDHAQRIKVLIQEQKERQEGWFVSAKESADIGEYINTLQTKLSGILKEQERAKDAIYEKDKKALQLERDKQAILGKAKNSIAELAKAEAARRNKFAKSSPYFETINHLKNQKEALDAVAGKEDEIKAIREDYNNIMNASISSNAEFTKYIDYQLDKNRELSKLSLESKNKELDIKTRMAVIDNEIANGNKTNILELTNLNKSLVDIKIEQLKADRAKLYFTALTSDTLDAIENRELAILNIDKQIAKLLLDVDIKNSNILKSNESITKELDKQLGILKAQQSQLGDAKAVIDIQEKMGTISSEDAISAKWALDRAESLKKQEIYQKEIAKLNKLSANDSKVKAANDAKASELQSKYVLESYKLGSILSQANLEREKGIRLEEKQLQLADKTLANASKLLDIERTKAGGKGSLDKVESQLIVKHNLSINKSTKLQKDLETKIANIKEDSLERQQLQADLKDEQLTQMALEIDYAEKLRDLEKDRFERQKEATKTGSNTVDTGTLIGKNFEKASKDFSDAMMNPVDRITDATLRMTDTAVDTLYDSIKAGENVGEAIKNALIETADNIVKEITTDYMKDLIRKSIASLTGQETSEAKAERIAKEAQMEQEKHTQLLTEIANNCKSGPSNPSSFSTNALDTSGFSFGKLTEGFDKNETFQNMDIGLGNIGDASFGTWESITEGNSLMEDSISSANSNFSVLTGEMSQGLNQISSNIGLIGSAGGIGGASSGGSGIGSTIGGMFGGFGGAIGGIVDMFFAKGGITNSLQRYATGGITAGPEIAMIGDNSSGKEAIVPLPSGEKIPVEFMGDSSGGDTIINNNITIQGNPGDPAAIRRSAGQVAQAAGNATNRAVRRNG